MVAKYECPDRGSSVITSLPELLGVDHQVWAFIEVVEALDLSFLYERRPAVGGKGRPGYDPTMMLTLLLFGLVDAKRSSRVLEAACREDLRYMAICGLRIRPDHATIARFRRSVDDIAGDDLDDYSLDIKVDDGQGGTDTATVPFNTPLFTVYPVHNRQNFKFVDKNKMK